LTNRFHDELIDIQVNNRYHRNHSRTMNELIVFLFSFRFVSLLFSLAESRVRGVLKSFNINKMPCQMNDKSRFLFSMTISRCVFSSSSLFLSRFGFIRLFVYDLLLYPTRRCTSVIGHIVVHC
jgi:hypothetical protein